MHFSSPSVAESGTSRIFQRLECDAQLKRSFNCWVHGGHVVGDLQRRRLQAVFSNGKALVPSKTKQNALVRGAN